MASRVLAYQYTLAFTSVSNEYVHNWLQGLRNCLCNNNNNNNNNNKLSCHLTPGAGDLKQTKKCHSV